MNTVGILAGLLENSEFIPWDGYYLENATFAVEMIPLPLYEDKLGHLELRLLPEAVYSPANICLVQNGTDGQRLVRTAITDESGKAVFRFIKMNLLCSVSLTAASELDELLRNALNGASFERRSSFWDMKAELLNTAHSRQKYLNLDLTCLDKESEGLKFELVAGIRDRYQPLESGASRRFVRVPAESVRVLFPKMRTSLGEAHEVAIQPAENLTRQDEVYLSASSLSNMKPEGKRDFFFVHPPNSVPVSKIEVSESSEGIRVYITHRDKISPNPEIEATKVEVSICQIKLKSSFHWDYDDGAWMVKLDFSIPFDLAREGEIELNLCPA